MNSRNPDLPESLDVTLYVVNNPRYGDSLQVLSSELVEYGYVTLFTYNLTIPVPPDLNLPALQLQMLQQQKQKIYIDAEQEVQKIEEQIQSLLALEHQEDAKEE